MINDEFVSGCFPFYIPYPQLIPNFLGETDISPYHSDKIPNCGAHSGRCYSDDVLQTPFTVISCADQHT